MKIYINGSGMDSGSMFFCATTFISVLISDLLKKKRLKQLNRDLKKSKTSKGFKK